jgi:hypothetical protein
MLALICSLNPSLSYCGKEYDVPFASKVQHKKKKKNSEKNVRYKKEKIFYVFFFFWDLAKNSQPI